ncbi:MAG: hypothetical protein RIG61_04430 [Deltaproteobacteria bacterium]
MKKLNCSFLLIALSLIPFFLNTAYASEQNGKTGDAEFPSPYVKKYPFKSLVINYKGKTEYGHPGMEKKTYQGSETVYIEGDRFAKTVKMSLPSDDGEPRTVERLQIIDPEFVYFIDLADKSGKKIDNSAKYAKPEYEKLSKTEKEAFHKRMDRRGVVSLDLLGLGKKTGTGEILGRKCDIYEYGEKPTEESLMTSIQAGIDPPYYRKTWIWREAKIPLKMVTEQFTSVSELMATDIEVDVDITQSRFEVPDDIKVTYDEKMSEASKEESLARFRLYKTGKAMMYKVKVEEEQDQGTDKDNSKTDDGNNRSKDEKN